MYTRSIPCGLTTYNLFTSAAEWEGYKIWEFCNEYWIYIPKRVHDLIEFSLWQKHGLCKIRIDCLGGEYKYHSYYGTTLISKSNKLLHAIKELIKYK